MKIKLTLLGIGFASLLYSQKSMRSDLKPVAGDCSAAIPIVIGNNCSYGPTAAPDGFGERQEITVGSKQLFKKEHNTAWYVLNIQRDGELVFEVVPVKPTDDYDFILYKCNSNAYCGQLSTGKMPLRSNLSRVDNSIQGISGLMANVTRTSVGEGIGNAYSQSLTVKKGEKYMLILDNVYANGMGHTLFFSYLKEVEIKGKIVNSENLPIQAYVLLSDNLGNTVEKTMSNKEGEYDFKTTLKENENYNLITRSERTFIQNTRLNTNMLKESSAFNNVDVVLPLLKAGTKYNFGNINFYGNLPDLLPCSYPSAEALYQLMLANKKLVIQIEGHVNKGAISNATEASFNQLLSEQRAITLYDFLIKKGISKDRLSTVGLAATQMLFPMPKNESEQEANRRVEIKITSMD